MVRYVQKQSYDLRSPPVGCNQRKWSKRPPLRPQLSSCAPRVPRNFVPHTAQKWRQSGSSPACSASGACPAPPRPAPPRPVLPHPAPHVPAVDPASPGDTRCGRRTARRSLVTVWLSLRAPDPGTCSCVAQGVAAFGTPALALRRLHQSPFGQVRRPPPLRVPRVRTRASRANHPRALSPPSHPPARVSPSRTAARLQTAEAAPKGALFRPAQRDRRAASALHLSAQDGSDAPR